MNHTHLTIAIPFDRSRAGAVDVYLDTLGNPANKQVAEALDAPAFVHFMSISAIPGAEGEEAHLVIEASVDGDARPACERLVAALGGELRQIFAAAGIAAGARPLEDMLLRHRIVVGRGWFSTPGLDFDGTPGMSVDRIRREWTLANNISQMLDSQPPFATPRHALDHVRARLWSDHATKWAFVAEPAPILEGERELWKQIGPIAWSAFKCFLWPCLLFPVLGFAAACFFTTVGTAAWIAAAILAAELVLLGLVYREFRRKEETDVPDDLPPSRELVQAMMERESHARQSLLAAVSIRKPGALRLLTLRVGLWAAGLTYWLSRPGFLTQIGVIHFARWVLLPGTNKLVFFSNYDGAWESYLEDFIERGARGVSGIWSNTEGFPKTSKLLNGGAADGDRLRRWTRRQMFPARFWYTAYPDLTLNRIRANAAIRQGIATATTETQAADWLACFGSAPRPDGTLETAEIPTLVFGGLKRLRFGTSLLVRLGDDVAQAKAWLAKVEPDVSYGDKPARGPEDGRALVLGLTQSGLLRLGLKEDHLATFPLAFQDGSVASWRARALGDVGKNDPKGWKWGGPECRVDAALIIYARDQQALDGLVAARRRQLEEFGHDLAYQLTFKELPEELEKTKEIDMPKEPFGFVDGIAQPIIRGTNRAVAREKHHQAVEPGEFILGYPDNLGYIPSTPSVPAAEDPGHLLPAVARPSGQRPNFPAPLADGQNDLGGNGTYLVVRQLEQNVSGFEDFIRDAAVKLQRDPRVPFQDLKDIEEWVAAKIVGRWKNGSSLVRYPHEPGTTKKGSPIRDNDFLFAEDPSGMRCPFGAHIRRANPRESFVPGSQEQLKISNRHRIFRVGRIYEPQNGERPGLAFMCLNTDIERQFEFVQQTWLMAPSFHGLENEVDAALNNRGDANVFTIPTPSGPLRVKGMKDFVTVRGSAYFFMPGRRALHYLAQ